MTKKQRGGGFRSDEPHVSFVDSEFTGVDFGKLDVQGFHSSDSVFRDCSFRGARLRGVFSATPQTQYTDCDFGGLDLREMRPGHARFEGCSFADVRILEWFAFCAEFVGCTFSGSIKGSRFSGKPAGPCAESAKRRTNQFVDNDFSGAQLDDVDFAYGIDVNLQRWPEGPEWIVLDRLQERIAAARAQVIQWEDLLSRKAALIALDAIGGRVPFEESGTMDAGQTQGWVTRRDAKWIGLPVAARNEFWRLLETA